MSPFFFCRGPKGSSCCSQKFGGCSACKNLIMEESTTRKRNNSDELSADKKAFVAEAKKNLKACHLQLGNLEEKNNAYFNLTQLKRHCVLNCSMCEKFHYCLKTGKNLQKMIDNLTEKSKTCLAELDELLQGDKLDNGFSV